jgi:hypothetical protein
MTEQDFLDFFSRIERDVQPRSEFVEQLLADIDEAALAGGVTDLGPSPSGGFTNHPHETEDTAMTTLVEVRSSRSRVIVAAGVVVAALAAAIVLLVLPGGSDHKTNVSVNQPTTLPGPDSATRAFLDGLRGPYLSYHGAIDTAFSTCQVTATVDVNNCRSAAQDAVTATNALVAALSRLQAPPSLASVPPTFRAALATVVADLNNTIAAATANNTAGVRANAGQFAGADTDLCGPLTQLNQIASAAQRFPTPSTTTSC